MRVCVFICMCVIAAVSRCVAEVSGQEESGSGARGQQCGSPHLTVPHLHTVRHTHTERSGQLCIGIVVECFFHI